MATKQPSDCHHCHLYSETASMAKIKCRNSASRESCSILSGTSPNRLFNACWKLLHDKAAAFCLIYPGKADWAHRLFSKSYSIHSHFWGNCRWGIADITAGQTTVIHFLLHRFRAPFLQSEPRFSNPSAASAIFSLSILKAAQKLK